MSDLAQEMDPEVFAADDLMSTCRLSFLAYNKNQPILCQQGSTHGEAACLPGFKRYDRSSQGVLGTLLRLGVPVNSKFAFRTHSGGAALYPAWDVVVNKTQCLSHGAHMLMVKSFHGRPVVSTLYTLTCFSLTSTL